MNAQGNSYLSNNININKDRYITLNNESTGNRKRLGDRTLFSHSIDGKRYYSSLDAEIYFGETYIDNVVQISWGVEQATMPLFGYNSYTFDDIAIGARQISGSFVINFTKSGFMYDVLRSVQAVNRSTLNTPEKLNDPANLNWTSHYDKEHKASWDRSFNIRVGYGDYNKEGKDTSMIVLYCVQITGCQQVLGIDGAPIAEAYTFIARDIRYDITGIPEKDPVITDENNSNSSIGTTQNQFNILLVPLGIIEEGTSSNARNSNRSSTDVDAITGAAPTNPNQIPIPKYYIKVKYSCGGGEVSDIKLTMKKANGEVINTSALSIGNNNEITYEIPREFHKSIQSEFNSQRSLGATSLYLICDFRIIYAINGKIQSPYSSTNKKVSLTQ